MAPPDAEAFLPRIRCVFYATFDQEQGPKVACQVPEGSIITSPTNGMMGSVIMDRIPENEARTLQAISSRPPSLTYMGSSPSISRGKGSQGTGLFEFDSVVEYIIPKDQICGRLVRCNTPSHRILGFPIRLTGPRYGHLQRYEFRYNLCFVFDRLADLSCYEPVVRKCGRVLLACEQESGLLSSPDYLDHVQPILEQLYEDLNSYSETSIPVDSFNSIELQIFPFYPNPPIVYDWQVPVALLNLEKRKDSSWDLTMAKITSHINGVNHAQRIGELADVSPELTRHCLEHLLFYQCVMMMDIFQFSNMYTFKSNVQWLAEESSVREECAPYVTRPGYSQAPLTDLLYLYSRLKPGKTVHAWMEENGIVERGIDVQRFVTFGVIKGFLRRIHRWPVLLPRERTDKRVKGVAFEESAANQQLILTHDEVATTNAAVGTSGEKFATSPPRPRSSTAVARPPPNQISFPPIPAKPQYKHASHSDPALPSFSRGMRAQETAKINMEHLSTLLDGSRHTDELCTTFRVSWQELEGYLAIVGDEGGELSKDEAVDRDLGGSDSLGRVRIVYH